ncbi:MAG: hypothetical protein WBC93_16515 [Sulfitobacter sp.]
MHYRPTPFRACVDENLPKHVAGTRAAVFALLRDHPDEPEAGGTTDAVPARDQTPKPQPAPEEQSRWESVLREDSFEFAPQGMRR